MKVIRPGKNPDDESHRGTCPRCGCVVEVSRSECEYVYDPRPGEGGYYVLCPTCNGHIWPKGLN